MKSAQPIQPQEPIENQESPDFELTSEEVPPATQASKAVKKTAKAPKKSPTKTHAPDAAQVLSYRHADRRKNNPEVGLVNEASDPEQPKTRYAYDPHLDPVLQWSGKTERTSFEVDTVSLHVHERIDAMSILSAVSKRQDAAKKRADPARSTGATAQNYAKGFQPGLFDAPFENLPLHSAIDFYKHDRGWANRLVAGDSLLVMNSLLQKEGMAGQVQMIYVVQTSYKVIERCMLMTTDPGDLVLDPTCGSGTTAYVAEKWGRRWITCDTSRVAITLAKQRLMTASFDYFALRYPHEGLKGGFIYKTVPHVTLKSIANNPEIDTIYERLHPGIDAALAELNAALAAHPPPSPYTVTEGVRKGQTLALGLRGAALLEWEVPFDFPQDWPAAVQPPFAAFHSARQKMQSQMDRSIASNADSETLYDQPEKEKNRLRVCGPFTVEAVPFPTVLSLEERSPHVPRGIEADLADISVARSGITSRQHTWRDELLKTGVRGINTGGKGGQKLQFAELEVLPGTTCLHASGHLDSGERVVVSFGPEHGALEQRQVEHALREAGDLFPLPKMIVFCAFAFDPEAAKDIDAVKGITALKAQMNTDLLTEDLKKAASKSSTNQSFWLMGQPDVQVTQLPSGLWQVEVNGFDYFDTAKGELVSGGKTKIAAWSLDTDYDGRSLFPHQFFFPMAGKDEGWMKLKKDIRAELNEDLLQHFTGTVSLPFAAGANATVAVKIVDDRGIESLRVMRLEIGEMK